MTLLLIFPKGPETGRQREEAGMNRESLTGWPRQGSGERTRWAGDRRRETGCGEKEEEAREL